MNLKEQTVYVLFDGISQYRLSTTTGTSKNIHLKELKDHYCLSKEQLTEFLASESMLKRLREEFLLATQDYPPEYHEMFQKKYDRVEKYHKQFINNILNH